MGNNPIGQRVCFANPATVACAVAVEEAMK